MVEWDVPMVPVEAVVIMIVGVVGATVVVFRDEGAAASTASNVATQSLNSAEPLAPVATLC